MELINTKELYENDAFVIIEAEFEDSETKKRIQEIALGLKNISRYSLLVHQKTTYDT